MILCQDCHLPYPQDSTPYRCPKCSGLFDFVDFPEYNPNQVSSEPGIWRFRHTFNLVSDSPRIYLGEGDTPLVWLCVQGKEVAFKLEFLNPTSSFKDRGAAVVTSFLCSREVDEAVDDSSGNAGASFAAYAAFAGLKARIFVPDYASGPKREQISAYGAEVETVPGPRSNASKAVRLAADKGAVYASHACLPHFLPGYATVAYELIEQLGTAPGTIIVPAGQGNLLLAIGRALQVLYNAKKIDHFPKLIGVQSKACAPLWTVFHQSKASLDIKEGNTIAEGVRIINPYRLDALINIVRESNGTYLIVEEDAISSGQKALALQGLFVEPTSAIVWNALEQIIYMAPDPIVVVLTGSGLKAL
jgi:threonine synthase